MVRINGVTPHAVYLSLGCDATDRGQAYRKQFSEVMNASLICDIRWSLNTGLVLDNERFRNEVEQLTGQRQRLEKRGPKPALLEFLL